MAVRQVRDFLDLSDIGYPWVFNVADVLLVAGVGILMIAWAVQAWHELRQRPSQTSPTADR